MKHKLFVFANKKDFLYTSTNIDNFERVEENTYLLDDKCIYEQSQRTDDFFDNSNRNYEDYNLINDLDFINNDITRVREATIFEMNETYFDEKTKSEKELSDITFIKGDGYNEFVYNQSTDIVQDINELEYVENPFENIDERNKFLAKVLCFRKLLESGSFDDEYTYPLDSFEEVEVFKSSKDDKFYFMFYFEGKESLLVKEDHLNEFINSLEPLELTIENKQKGIREKVTLSNEETLQIVSNDVGEFFRRLNELMKEPMELNKDLTIEIVNFFETCQMVIPIMETNPILGSLLLFGQPVLDFALEEMELKNGPKYAISFGAKFATFCGEVAISHEIDKLTYDVLKDIVIEKAKEEVDEKIQETSFKILPFKIEKQDDEKEDKINIEF